MKTPAAAVEVETALADFELATTRMRTHALILQADPVLQDLRHQLALAQELSERLMEES